MTSRTIGLRLGGGAILAALFLGFYLIPTWVSSPSNVRHIIMSPVFWPNVVAGLMALIGVGLIAGALRPATEEELPDPDTQIGAAPWLRLLGMGVIMALSMVLMPRLGMVPTTMMVFAATAFLMRTRHPVAAVICAVMLPLVLYAFFAHVAGVAIPQADFLRLP